MLCALIMAGGIGKRFWPLSTEEKPKQFLKLIGYRTMIQMTVDRIRPIVSIEKIFVCTGQKYIKLVKEQLPELPEENIIVEPESRNTAPCIALSSLIISRRYSDTNMIILPSDHIISDEYGFRKIIKSADIFVEENKKSIITLGMHPVRPETGYGYIKYDDEAEIVNDYKVLKVDKFIEKPDEAKAEKYLESGNYLWNGGILVLNNNSLLDKIKKYMPKTYMALKEIKNTEQEDLQKVINTQYSKTEHISIDYAVLEKSDDIYVIPSDIGWDDIGSINKINRYRKQINKEYLSEYIKF